MGNFVCYSCLQCSSWVVYLSHILPDVLYLSLLSLKLICNTFCSEAECE